ncbi:hypothetical protein MTES_0445 [Microbacterium testaceum StLB037]|uniref:Uncharacterized protein n=1 Tax=Microbacterium testaceum (strain StLB037) TaxID=979556 RepID=E8NAY7_MICTS|nr:hypothetical protein [Microbacterium testaceum]BAJ73409.1 hypothetical protein MTES_0445 [Microbacterium testaceum StLB037]
MRARTRTWRTGGILLGVAGVLTLLAGQYMVNAFALRLVIDLVWAAGVVVFAVGFSRDASVVARRPLGMTALVIAAATPLVSDGVMTALPDAFSADDPVIAAISVVSWGGWIVSAAAGLVAAVQIARLGAVPPRWRWMPMWALCLTVGAAAVQYITVSVLFGAGAGQDVLVVANMIGVVSALAPTLGLGVVALVAAASERPDSVDIYRSA